MKTTMRVLSITPTFAPSIGGIEQVVQELAIHLNARDDIVVDVAHVATSHGSLTKDIIEGLTVYRVPLIGHRLFGLAPALRDLGQSYDLLHVHDPQLMALTASVKKYCPGIPAVLSTHGGFHHTNRLSHLKAVYERLFLRRALAHYRSILASSVSDFAYFRQYSEHVKLCSNGVNTDKFSQVLPSAKPDLCRWVYWGRLSRNKRVDCVIETVAVAHKQGHQVDLLVCGRDFDGILPSLKAQVSALGLERSVRFEEYLTDQQLLSELASRSVYVSASEHEGFGLSIVEAMAAGLVVMCRDMSPLNSFVEHTKSGCFMGFDHSDQDKRSLLALLQCSQTQAIAMSTTARTTAQRYNWGSASEVFLNYFRESLNSPALPHTAHLAREKLGRRD